MITGKVRLHTTDLDDNLQLVGFEINPPVGYSVRDLLGGNNVIQIDSRSAGAALALTAIYEGTRKVGQYCQYQIEELRAAAALGDPVQLIHPHGGPYTVYILDFDITQTEEKELPGPNKKFHGSVLLQQK